MRLSEAIRLGATMRPQAFAGYFRDGGSCALGAAAEARFRGDIRVMRDHYHDTLSIKARCPICIGMNLPMIKAIEHLNDYHKWTRERIADFVELHEPMPEPLETAIEELPQLIAPEVIVGFID